MNSIGVVYRIIEPYNRRRNQENGLSQWIGEIKCHYSINDYQIGKNDSVQRRDHCLRERHVRCNVRHRRERAKTSEREKCLAYLPLSENAWRVCRSMCISQFIFDVVVGKNQMQMVLCSLSSSLVRDWPRNRSE